MKRALVIACAVVLATMLLASCSSGGSSSTSASSSTQQVVPSSSPAQEPSGGADEVSIRLDYSAGTGFEWQCAVDPEGVVEQTGQTTKDLAEEPDITGGPLQDTFTFRALEPGEVSITFNLVRGWEDGESAETQVYAFTVDEDLNMILNPYKSDFANEPEWAE